LHKNIISIKARKEDLQKDNVVCKQRPNIIDKKIRLPTMVEEGKEETISAKFVQGVMTLKIPVSQKGKQISIE
jgi:HSP20 family molecular chaperone IbpA